MLFTREALEDLLRLHDLSYGLFRWVGSSLSGGSLSFAVVHGATDSAAAAEEWISRNLDNLPRDLRPRPGDLVPLSHLFASFLTTSFVLPAAPRVFRDVTVCGCTCCTYLVSAHRLVLRNPTAKDKVQAEKLQILCLEALAESEGVPLSVELRRSVPADPLLAQDLAHLSYAFELRRRSEYASQGTAVLAIWRSIAWENGRLRKSFALAPGRIVEAQSRLAAAAVSA